MTASLSLLLWGISALSSSAYGAVWTLRPVSAARTVIKTVPVAALAVLGLVSEAPALVVTGLALGAAGDAFLSRPGDRAFVAGLAAFAVGHLAYTFAMLRPEGLGAALILGLPVLAVAASTEVWLRPHTGTLAWPVRAYVVLIAAMALAALSLGAGHGLLQLGAGLFLLSDLLLAIELFVLKHRPRGAVLPRAVWASYWAGQALILAGASAIAG